MKKTPTPKHSVEPKDTSLDKETAPPREYVEHFKRHNLILGKRLGSGASGNVYRATQTKLARELAIKFFDHPNLKAKDAVGRKRFEHEARLLAIAQHPSIPFVLASGSLSTEGEMSTPYIIMQFIDGGALDVVIAKGGLSPQNAALHMKQVLAALACAHQHQIVHRDVKPENILMSRQGACYLIDFSIGVSLKAVPGLTRVTGDRRTPATMLYASPEQLAGRDVDHRTDLYSAGLVLFELLTGQRVTKPGISNEDLAQVPPGVRDLLRKACHPHLEKRFQSANDFLAELRRLEMPGISRTEPGDAICKNIRCLGVNWSRNGEYLGPFILRDAVKDFCPRCGSPVVYPCERCGTEFNHEQYCEGCGHQHYGAPSCERCGNRITRRDAARNTSVDGCSRCPSDDDIPF